MQSCSHRLCPLNQSMKTSEIFSKYVNSNRILLVPKHSLLKHFKLTFTRQKSSKFEGSGPPLRQGWVSLKRTCVFSGIQSKKHFIEFVFVEPNQLFGSNVNMILTRQTCGQSSSMSAGSKRRALVFYFSVRICYMFIISKCRGESNLGQRMTSVLGKRMRLRSADFRRIMRRNTFFNRKSALRSRILFRSTEVMR